MNGRLTYGDLAEELGRLHAEILTLESPSATPNAGDSKIDRLFQLTKRLESEIAALGSAGQSN